MDFEWRYRFATYFNGSLRLRGNDKSTVQDGRRARSGAYPPARAQVRGDDEIVALSIAFGF